MPFTRKTIRKRRYPLLTDQNIIRFAEIAKLTSESIIKEQSHKDILDPIIIKSLSIVEEFVAKNKLVVYGGTALNAVLPPSKQFYDKDFDLPDWDFFSDDPIRHAIEIADSICEKTKSETFVTTAAHHGTYKVFANGLAVADITRVDSCLLDTLRSHALIRDDILYSGPDYLRMAAYLELSRPKGQVERWEKVMKRLSLLNNAHPIKIRNFKKRDSELTADQKHRIFTKLTDLQKDDNLVFFGPECVNIIKQSLHSRRIPILKTDNKNMFPMLLSPSPRKTLRLVLKELRKEFEGQEIVSVCRKGRGEFLPKFNEIRFGKKGAVLCLIMGTNEGCQSIYRIPIKTTKSDTKHTITIASIETCLYLYLAIRMAKVLPVPASLLLKICDNLIRMHHHSLLKNKKPILPLPSTCVGSQITIKDMRSEKQKVIRSLFKEKNWKSNPKYFSWNIRYSGGDEKLRKTILRSLEKRKYNKTIKH